MRVAVHLILEHNNEFLLLRRYNTGYEDGNYSVIAGHLNGNETIKEVMIREDLEEANITIDDKHLKIVGVMHRKDGDESIDYYLYTNKFSGNIRIMEPNKYDDLAFYKLDNLPDNIIPYIKTVLYIYKNNIIFSEYGIH